MKKLLCSILVCSAVIMWSGTIVVLAAEETGETTASPRYSQYSTAYDPKTVETLSGTIIKIETFTTQRRAERGIYLRLRTENENIPVQLGPPWFLKKQQTTIKKGDKITVTGSRVTMRDEPVILAAEIRKGDEVIKLREKNGFPMWVKPTPAE